MLVTLKHWLTEARFGIRLRQTIQWLFFAWIVLTGVRFGLFVHHYESGGAATAFVRPPGVEGFLPIGALISLKHWLINGAFDRLHPAALVLFLTFIVLALLVKNAFCGWVCPVGALHEPLAALGRRLFGRNYRIWRPLDLLLRGIKYLLLLFFLNAIVIGLPAQQLPDYLRSPYWAIADVKMLHFFTRPSVVSLAVITVLVGLAVPLRNFWCRYLCPYGALLGLLSMLSLIKVRRQVATCTGCRACSRSCPQQIDVHRCTTVHSQECTGCLTCISRCPEPGVLAMQLPFWRRSLANGVFALLVILLFATGVGLGMASGHWQSALTDADYRQLIPLADRFGH